MATVITVHGTFAHLGGPADDPTPADPQWWQPGSTCEEHIRKLVDANDGTLTFRPFTWSGENSEWERRRAASKLLAVLDQLEAKKESYCLIGHSHGGSVIASALVQSVAKGRPLEGLKQWITVGTPFVSLMRQRFLFERLSLPRKVAFVASLMLLIMFLVYVAGEVAEGGLLGRSENRLWRFAFSGVLMSVPFVFFYAILKYFDARRYFAYRPKLLQQIREAYAHKWLPLSHEDDEAIQGLKLLPGVKLRFFDRNFAVPVLTLASIFVLPLAYLFVVTSPTLMVAIADVLKNKVYNVEQYRAADPTVEAARRQLSGLRRKLQQSQDTAERPSLDPTVSESVRQEVETLRQRLSETRKNLLRAHPELPRIARAQRFKQRFLEQDGKPCEGGTLCGGGRNFRLNSELLFHIVTDEFASTFVDQDMRWGPLGGLVRLALPIVLVPIVFALVALGFLVLIRFVAGFASALLSGLLNRLTHHELTRSALGNDTDGEIALGADSGPTWVSLRAPFLPSDLGDKISDYSNQISFQSLSKFRNAISTLAFAEGQESKAGMITTYLTWRELIHTCYFEVAEFRKLLAYAIAQAEGFKAGEAFKSDPDYGHASRWYGMLKSGPAT